MFDHEQHADEEEIGIRAMDFRREKAVERALQLLRHGLGPRAGDLTPEAVTDLEFAFGEIWRYVAHAEWDELRFSNLTFDEITRIRALAQELRGDCHDEAAVLGEIEAFLREPV